MEINWLFTTSSKLNDFSNLKGGTVYDKLAFKILNKHYNISVIHLPRPIENSFIKKAFKMISFYRSIGNINIKEGILFQDSIGMAFTPEYKNLKKVTIIHHINYDFLNTWKQRYLANNFFRKIKTSDYIIAVSEFWKSEFIKLGAKNVKVIYNPFEPMDFAFKDEEIINFKKKYSIPFDKPIIYLGNCREEKGVVGAYNALKNKNYFFVTSGFKMVDLPVLNLNLEYKDYLKLLTVSDIVLTMSKITEGWCRTAHEAMLCRTPVIGSGTGGMKELLNGGKQIMVRNFNELEPTVQKILTNKNYQKELIKEGQSFASKFDMKYFESELLHLINEIILTFCVVFGFLQVILNIPLLN